MSYKWRPSSWGPINEDAVSTPPRADINVRLADIHQEHPPFRGRYAQPPWPLVMINNCQLDLYTSSEEPIEGDNGCDVLTRDTGKLFHVHPNNAYLVRLPWGRPLSTCIYHMVRKHTSGLGIEAWACLLGSCKRPISS